PPTYQRRAPLRLPLVPRNGCGRPGRAPERFLPLDITSLLLHVIFDARFLLRQEIAEMQNETQKEIAGIQSATSRQNTKDQVYAQNEMLAYQQKESTARVASIMENTNLS